MNYDRLCTRVWDKQEKKMLYPGENSFHFKHFEHHEPQSYVFRGIIGSGLICENVSGICTHIDFGTRFISMQCLGAPDKKEKLIYEGDIVESSNEKYLVCWYYEAYAFWFERVDNECARTILDFESEIKIIGNIYENKELMEESI